MHHKWHWCSYNYYYFLKILFYLFMRGTEREREREAEGEAGSMQEARCGSRSWVSRILLRAEGGAKPLGHRGCPAVIIRLWFKCHAVQGHLLILFFKYTAYPSCQNQKRKADFLWYEWWEDRWLGYQISWQSIAFIVQWHHSYAPQILFS